MNEVPVGPAINSVLGILFVVTGAGATFLMFYLWGFPYDAKKHKSTAPRSLTLLHRGLGYTFVLIYLVLMAQMVPRLWKYQIELPPRTVVHMTFGMAIGMILIIKVSIVRYFKHLSSSLIPILGTCLLISAFLTVSMSVPFAFKEMRLSSRILGSDAASVENMQRVNQLLAVAGLDDEAHRNRIATKSGMEGGRSVLLSKCVLCHDLRTCIAKPKSAENWWATVNRMSKKATVFQPITKNEQWLVTGYLIAVSPNLDSQVLSSTTDNQSERTEGAPSQPEGRVDESKTGPLQPANYSANRAKFVMKRACSKCHNGDVQPPYLPLLQESPPSDFSAAEKLIARMIENGLELTESEREIVTFYLSKMSTNRAKLSQF